MATCADCQFYSEFGTSGNCRARPPRVRQRGHTYWPKVLGSDWCGEHEPAKPDAAASLALMTEAMAPFIVAANAMGAETSETLLQLDLTDDNGDPIALHSDDFLRLADAFAKATGA